MGIVIKISEEMKWMKTRYIGLLILTSCLIPNCQLTGQGQVVTLEEALVIALTNYSGITNIEMRIAKQSMLASAGKSHTPAQIFLSGEEFNFADEGGIHSLNIQQNFNLPKVNSAWKDFYTKKASLGTVELELTKLELIREVKKAFFELIYAKENRQLQERNIVIYEDFLNVTSALLEDGESGILPQLAAKTSISKAQLELEHSEERHLIARSLFNIWLDDETIYDASGKLNVEELSPTRDIDSSPHLLQYERRKDVALANIETKKTQLIPVLNTGLRLQTNTQTFPLFGYQIGMNVPLFKGRLKKQIEASEKDLLIVESERLTYAKQIQRTLTVLEHQITHQLHIIENIEKELLPLVEEQVRLNRLAYQEGESSYLNYINGLKEKNEAQQRLLDEKYQLKLLRIDWEFWTHTNE